MKLIRLWSGNANHAPRALCVLFLILTVTELSFVVADSSSLLFDASILLVTLDLVQQRAKRVMYKNSTYFLHTS